jgi:hypothetical protein
MKRIDIREFREQGYLQEANRRFFHPLGLALTVVVDADGSERLGGVQDYRDDPEGIVFAPAVDLTEKAELVSAEWERRFWERIERFRYMVQPVACPNPGCRDGWIAWGSGNPWVEEGRDRCPLCEHAGRNL